MNTLYGYRVVIEQLRPRYTLPPDVPPGTDCTREEFEEWSARVCGFQKPLLNDGTITSAGDTLYMSLETFEKIKIANYMKGL